MTTSKQDLAYGRQGGRIVPWKGAGAPALCDVCKQPMTAGQEGSHLSCRPALELITVRDDRYRGSTLARIDRLHDWQPSLALFNSFGMPSADAAPIKRRHMLESVYPTYGDDPGRYLALESNWKTRAMYARLGVPAVRVNPEKQWTSLPHPKPPTMT